ncbi:hypothetical protein RBB50_002548 [Rhinocladiella similis]
MCITEIWTYRDCGCCYNHIILCRSYRRGGTPCFAPSIHYPRDKWLEGTATDPELAFRVFKGRTKPTEPQACPQHSIDYNSFLNPICEDCLLAEVNSLSADGIGPAPPAYADSEAASGEGLVWDSEVKVEIESQTSQDQPVPAVPVSDRSSHNSQDIDRTILDSHVEVTIESDGSSVSTDEPTSPLLSSLHTQHSSPPSTVATSPKSLGSCEKRRSASHNSPDEKDEDLSGEDLSSDLGDSDDEGADSCDDQHCQPLPSRGRSLVRGNGAVMKRSVTDPVPLLMPVEKSKSKKGLSTLKSIRSISLNFRPATKPKVHAATTEHDISLNEQNKLARSRSKNPFRAFRHRKASQNYVDTMRITPILTTLEVHSSLEVDQLSFEKPRLRPLPPRKSSMRNLGSFTDPAQAAKDRRRLPGTARRPDLSPTGSWSQNHTDQRKASGKPRFHLPVHQDVPFDAQSVFSDFEDEEPAQSSTGKSQPSNFGVPSALESAQTQPLRARIHGLETFELGLATPFPRHQEAQLSVGDQEVNKVEKAGPVVESTLLTESKPREDIAKNDFETEQHLVADEDQDQEAVSLHQNGATKAFEAHDEDTEEQSMPDPSEGFELIPLNGSEVRETAESGHTDTAKQSLAAPELNHADVRLDQIDLLEEIKTHDRGTLDSEALLLDLTDGSEEIDNYDAVTEQESVEDLEQKHEALLLGLTTQEEDDNHDGETEQHFVEDHESDQEQMFSQSIPTIKILETDQIISLYSYARKPKRKQPGKVEEVVSDDVSRTRVVSEDDEDSKISESTTPPSSPPLIEKEMSPTWSFHPPRKSSLRRLTGFNYSIKPLVDPDFPVPSLPSTTNLD